jgi:outer membrane protein
MVLFVILLLATTSSRAQTAQQPRSNDHVTPDYSATPKWFPQVLAPYRQRYIPPVDVNNTKSLSDMIRDGQIKLSLRDLAAAVVENNLNLAVARYNNYFAQADLLRAKSGQAARGVDTAGASIPDALFSSAIGAGVGGAAGIGGGVAGVGSISGATKSLSLQPRGAFDPTFTFDFSWDRTTSPLNTIIVAGSPVVTTNTGFYEFGLQQAFTTGTSLGVDLANQRQSSTQQALVYDPDVITRMSVTVVQQLTQGLSRTVNRRFQIVARNNVDIVRNWFLQQVNTTLAQAEESYWDLVAAQEQVKATEQALQVAQQLYNENKEQAGIGTLARLDVVSAEAQVASTQRDLIVAQTNLQQQELALKVFFSRQLTDPLGDAKIVATDPLPDPQESDIPSLDEAVSTAARNRPEMPQAQATVKNDQLAVKVTRSFLKPTLNAFGLVASAGLSGNQLIPVPGGLFSVLPGGVGQELNQFIRFKYPEYAIGFALTIPIKNRSALADNARASLLEQQAEVSLQSTEKQVGLEVRTAISTLMQAQSLVSAASSAVMFSKRSADAEEEKRSVGMSTPYNVILAQKNLLSAELGEVQARDAYAKALIQMQQSMGVLLDKSHIEAESAVQGSIRNTQN